MMVKQKKINSGGTYIDDRRKNGAKKKYGWKRVFICLVEDKNEVLYNSSLSEKSFGDYINDVAF